MNNKKFIFLIANTILLSATQLSNASNRLPGVVDKNIKEYNIPKNYKLDSEREEDLIEEPSFKEFKIEEEEILPKLKNVIFEGNKVVSDKDIKNIIKEFIGKNFNQGDLARLKYLITKLYYNKGYIIVKVVSPPQTLEDSILKLKIYESKMALITLNTNQQLRKFIGESIIKQIKTGQIFKESSVESVANDLNDLKNIKAKVILKPGKQIASTDIDINLTESDNNEDQRFIQFDNYGSKLTGNNVASLFYEKSNYFKLGETFSLRLKKSSEKLFNIGASLSTPIGYKNLFLNLDYFHSNNDIDGRLKNLGASGKTENFSVSLSSKLLNTRFNQINLELGGEFRMHESFLNKQRESKDNIRKVFLSANYLSKSKNMVLYNFLKISKGLNIFGANHRYDIDSSRSQGIQDAYIFNPGIIGHFRFSDSGVFKVRALGQLSSHKLLSSDLFTIGGYNSVRGFEVAQEAGESGYNLNLSYMHDIPTTWNNTKIKIGPYFDMGAVFNKDSNNSIDPHLYSAGFAFEIDKLIYNKNLNFLIDYSRTLGHYDATYTDPYFIYGKLRYDF